MSGKHTSSKRVSSEGRVSWSNYDGTKSSHDVAVTQMNYKDTATGDHTFYNPKSGVQGVAGGDRKK